MISSWGLSALEVYFPGVVIKPQDLIDEVGLG